MAAGIAYFRLKQGPVSLMAFAGQIEHGIEAELDGLKARMDDATVTLSRDGAFEIRLVNLRISEPDGDLVASAPLAAVELSATDLLYLRAVPERVFLIEPKLSITYSEEGGFELRFAGAGAPAKSGQKPAADGEWAAATTPEGEAASATPAQTAAPPAAADPSAIPVPPPAELAARFKKVDLVRMLAESSARARRGETTASVLKEIGLRDASVTLDYAGRSTEIRVVDASLDLEHRKRRSTISGAAKFDSPRGPWVLTFKTLETERSGQLTLTTSVRDFVPSTLSGLLPQLGLLEMVDLPVASDASLELSTAGDLQTAKLAVELGKGFLRLPGVPKAPMIIDAGLLSFNYEAEKKRLSMAPSTLKAGDSRLTVEGTMTGGKGAAGDSEWRFGFNARDGLLAAEEFGVAGIPVEQWVVEGRMLPKAGQLELSRFSAKAGGAEVTMEGELRTAPSEPGLRLEGKISPMTVETLKALWPRPVAPVARDWVGKNVHAGTLSSGTLKHVSGSFLADGESGMTDRRSIALEASNLDVAAGASGIPIEVPRALIRLENEAVEISVPEAAIVPVPGKKIPLKAVSFTMKDAGGAGSRGELGFRSQAQLGAVIEALRKLKPDMFEAGVLPLQGLEGKADAQFKVTLPLDAAAAAAEVTVEGKARITDINSKQKIGSLALQGGTLDVAVAAASAEVTGDLILNGVLGKVAWQRIFGAAEEQQPPLRITARLDNSDRTQLGLDVNHLVQGDMAVEVAVTPGADAAAPGVHVRADLTAAELLFKDLAWKKPAGKPATVEFDVAKGKTHPLELQNFKITGDNIAAEGWLAIDAENEVREFYFPDFSLNVVTRLEVQGKLSNAKIWDVKTKGSAFDGRDLFRALVSLNQSNDPALKPRKPSNGIDLSADIDTMIGHSGVSMRQVKVKLSERREKLIMLDVQGTLDGGKPVAVALSPDAGGPRTLFADSTDAGQVFKLVGFYPNLEGGRVRLEVNLDGKGAAEKTGTLWVEDFKILGDPVVQEVLSSGSAGGIDGAPQSKKVVREVLQFERMRVPFAAGHGQFVLEDSYLRGPIVGATLRGKVDYTQQRVNLGGTYVPLQGLNSALGGIPLLGELLNGPRGEGIFGITFAIQGAMSQPQVVVNPLSLVAPGIFREIFQIADPKTRVQARPNAQQNVPVEQRVRASSSTVEGGAAKGAAGGAAGSAATIDGWSSETSGAPSTKKQ